MLLKMAHVEAEIVAKVGTEVEAEIKARTVAVIG